MLENENNKLLPCPFCGSMLIKKQLFATSPDTYLLCTSCGVGIKGRTYDEAVKNWNRRSNVSQKTVSVNGLQRCEKCLSENIIYKIHLSLKGDLWIWAECQDCGWGKFLSHAENLKLRQNSALANWRAQVVKRDGGRCRLCGSREKLEVHHIIAVSCDPERKFMYNVDNGITLCHACHVQAHKNPRSRFKEAANE